MFVRTEHQYAYEQLFATVTNYTNVFFNVNLAVRYGSLDHAAYIANAYEAVWPGITLLDCYPHVVRKCRDKLALLKGKTYLVNNIMVNIKQMHSARSPEQFQAMVTLCLTRWRRDKETVYADWFEKVYLPARWMWWFITSGTPGVVPNQNALESHNNVIKTFGVSSLRARTGVVLNNSLPTVFVMTGADAPKGPFGHYCDGPIVSKMIFKVGRHTEKKAYYIKSSRVNRQLRPQSVFFNASAYMASRTRSDFVDVTLDRVKRYLESKGGKLRSDDTVHDISLHLLSLHEVKIIGSPDQLASFKLEYEPVIHSHKIKAIRTLYQCDCKSFWSTAWLCSHVLAAAALMKQFNGEESITGIPATKTSGGQRKIPGALHEDDPGNRTLSKPRLLNILVLYPRNWQISKVVDREEDGEMIQEFLIGRVGIAKLKKKIYWWPVTYSDGSVELFECEDLVDLFVRSRRLGLDITSPELPALAELVAMQKRAEAENDSSVASEDAEDGTSSGSETSPDEL